MTTESYNPSPRATGFANASLILACAAILVGPFAGIPAIPAIICGHMALARMRKSPAIDGYGRALAGTILGYCVLVAFAAIVGLFVLYRALGKSAP